jgi:hypothetical protein
MSEQYVCPKCGQSYSIEELSEKMFCECGAFLSKAACKKVYLPSNEPTKVANPEFSHSHIPEKFKNMLRRTHGRCSEIIKNAGYIPEPLETALTVEEYRWFWKPEVVKFALVAESHVRTNDEELKVRIKPERLPSNYPGSGPLTFVKLVYCLGYGEPSILDCSNNIENNPGTKQYINLFAELVGLTHQRHYMTRLRWRTHVLNIVKEKGIWLLDASVHACYLGKKKRDLGEEESNRLPPEVVKDIVPKSWNKYVKPVIDDLNIDPKCVWIVGKGLHDLLRGKYANGWNWIYQPNARVSNERKNTRKLELRQAMKQCNVI